MRKKITMPLTFSSEESPELNNESIILLPLHMIVVVGEAYHNLIFFFPLIPYRKFGTLYLGKVKAAIRAMLPIPTVCTVLLCSAMVWPSVFGIDACNYILGPYEHCKSLH